MGLICTSKASGITQNNKYNLTDDDDDDGDDDDDDDHHHHHYYHYDGDDVQLFPIPHTALLPPHENNAM